MSTGLHLGTQLRHRIAKGVRAGGQFAVETRTEPSQTLAGHHHTGDTSPTPQAALTAWRLSGPEGREDLEPVLALSAGHVLATDRVPGAVGLALEGAHPGHTPRVTGIVGPDGALHPLGFDEDPDTAELADRLHQVSITTVGRNNTTITPHLAGTPQSMMLRTRAVLRPGHTNPFVSAALDHDDDESVRAGLQVAFPRLRGFELRPDGRVGRLFGLLNEYGQRLPGAPDDRTLRKRVAQLLDECPHNTRTGARWALNPDGPGEVFHTW